MEIREKQATAARSWKRSCKEVCRRKLKEVGRTLWKYRAGYIMVAPLMIGLVLFSFYPFVYGLALSFFNKTDKTMSFAGFDNFVELMNDALFWKSMATMGKIFFFKVLIGIVAPLVMAELIFGVRSEKMQNVYRILVLLPMIAPGVVGMLIWKQIYAVDGGVFNEVLKALGMIGKDIDWLGDSKYVLFSIIFLGFPWVGGTSVLIYMSGMVAISGEVFEASRLDGCSTLRRIFYIDLPLLRGQIRYFLVFGIIGALQDYSVQVVLTGGGPNQFDTYVPGYYMYKMAFTNNNFGYAAAIGTIIFVLAGLFTVIAYKFTGEKKEEL